MSKTRVYFRADGNTNIGLGHVTRSAALADMLRDDFDCHFFIRNPIAFLKKEITDAGALVHELPEAISYEEEAAQWADTLTDDVIVVLDGYNFGTDYQRAIKARGCSLVCIDDIFAYHFLADVIINHAGGIDISGYSRDPFTFVFTGPEYAILRRSFWNRTKVKDNDRKDAFFICMGGADPNNDTVGVLEKLQATGLKKECLVVVGAAYIHMDALVSFARRTSLNINIFSGVDSDEMLLLMEQCRYAVCPPSTVSYEYLSIGGELYLWMIADNQKSIHRFFLETGLAFRLEEFPVTDEARLKVSREKQAVFFDGRSDIRLRKVFLLLAGGKQLQVRLAESSDMALYHTWVNDEQVRRSAFSTRKITWDEHSRWFMRKLGDADTRMYLVQQGGTPVGQVRFEMNQGRTEALIDYSIAADFRGRGWGESMLRVAGRAFIKERSNPLRLIGKVKTDNTASCRIFERLSFELAAQEQYENGVSNIYILDINQALDHDSRSELESHS